MLTKPHDASRGQSRSPNLLLFDIRDGATRRLNFF